MKSLDMSVLREYVNEKITTFHDNRLLGIKNLKLNSLVSKNPYMFRAKNVLTAAEYIEQNLQAFLSSSEEKSFGSFLEDLAIFISIQTCNGHKSIAQGVDLEFIDDQIHYLISIKSGPRWGNAAQHAQLTRDLSTAVTRLKQSGLGIRAEAVLGICYGKTKTSFTRGYKKIVGQSFWYLISGNKDLYTDIVEPLGYNAKNHNDQFLQERAKIANKLTFEFMQRFCDPITGSIDWIELTRANSQNM